MAEQLLPAAEQERVAKASQHVEHEETGEGIHEKYLALAESPGARLG